MNGASEGRLSVYSQYAGCESKAKRRRKTRSYHDWSAGVHALPFFFLFFSEAFAQTEQTLETLGLKTKSPIGFPTGMELKFTLVPH